MNGSQRHILSENLDTNGTYYNSIYVSYLE